MSHFVKNILDEHMEVVQMLERNGSMIDSLCQKIVETFKRGGKIVIAGNGGSAADSQHLAAEFVGRFNTDRVALPAIALTTDTSILTAIGNDFGFDSVFLRQVEALCNGNDVLIAISTSGNSQNLITAVDYAKNKGIFTIGLLGKQGGKLGDKVDLPIIVPSNNTARIQECHILIAHILCQFCDESFS